MECHLYNFFLIINTGWLFEKIQIEWKNKIK